MVINKIVENLCGTLQIDKMRLVTILNNVRQKGYVYPVDVRSLAELGIPVISVISNILNIPVQKAYELCSETANKGTNEVCPPDITYEDLLIVLGIVAQDFEVRKQQAILRKYENK